MAADNFRAFTGAGVAQKTEPKFRDVMRVPHMGDGVHALYRYYRQRTYCVHPAHEALLLARYHEGKPEPRGPETPHDVRQLYRHYRQAHRFSPSDALRVARCHADGRG